MIIENHSGKQSLSGVYLITFTTYGSRLHGDARGTVDRHRRSVGFDPDRAVAELARMPEPPVLLSREARAIVAATVHEVCAHRGHRLLAVNARTNHVHVVVAGSGPAERMMVDFKAYSTRRLVGAGVFGDGARIWTRHGSIRALRTDHAVVGACRYVIERQGRELGVGEAWMPGS